MLNQDSIRRLLIISHDVVDAAMAGPGIRYWEIARILAQHCSVTLLVPNQCTLRTTAFIIQTYQMDDWNSLRRAAEQADIIMPCGFILAVFPQLAQLGLPIVIDGYDPYPIEALALAGRWDHARQTASQQSVERQLQLECTHADFILCASERQRFWWLGMLMIHGRLNVATYGADPTLRNLIDVVPFGCESTLPQHTRQVMKGVMPGIQHNDKVLLWGGGIWDWLDPLTLIRVMPKIIARHPNIRLVFPGTRHPNAHVPEMAMRQKAVDMANGLGLLNTHVFFGDWVPYADWQNYLLEADAGVSLHITSLETQLAFRSRILDYIRAGLPMVVNQGDITSEVVERYQLGLVVDCGDDQATADAILTLLQEPREARRDQFLLAQADFAWERILEPLARFCRHPYKAADAGRTLKEMPSQPDSVSAADSVSAEGIKERDAEIARLRGLVRGYESGRFIRFMRWLHGRREHTSGSGK